MIFPDQLGALLVPRFGFAVQSHLRGTGLGFPGLFLSAISGEILLSSSGLVLST